MCAYFSLSSYKNYNLNKALFLSPVVDMERIIENMMTWFKVTPESLEKEGTIDTPIGQKLYWDYYTYVKENPIKIWDTNTSILYGAKDELCEFDTIENYVDTFKCDLEIMATGEHFFHTDEQLEVFKKWLSNQIKQY